MDLKCPNCGKTLRLKDSLAGKRIRCPACQGVVSVPALELEDDELALQLDAEPEAQPAAPPPAQPGAPSPAPGTPDIPDPDRFISNRGVKRTTFEGAKKSGGIGFQWLIKPLVFFGALAVMGYVGWKIYGTVTSQYQELAESSDESAQEMADFMRNAVSGGQKHNEKVKEGAEALDDEQKKAFPETLEKLADEAVREKTLAELDAYGAALPELLPTALLKAPLEARMALAASAGDLKKARPAAVLLALQADPAARVRERAWKDLVERTGASAVVAEGLGRKYAGIRAAALRLVAEWKLDDQVNAAHAALSDRSPRVRAAACRVLGSGLGGPGAVMPLVDRLTDEHPAVALAASAALGSPEIDILVPRQLLEGAATAAPDRLLLYARALIPADDATTAALLQPILRSAADASGGVPGDAVRTLVTSPSAAARLEAVEALTVRPEAALPYLGLALMDADENVRREALAAVAHVQGPVLIMPLMSVAAGENADLGLQALAALARHGKEAVRHARAMIEPAGMRTTAPALALLAWTGDTEAKTQVQQRFAPGFATSPAAEARQCLYAVALQKAGALEDVGPLRAAIGDRQVEPTARIAYAGILASQGDESAVATLEEGLTHHDPGVRSQAARAMARLDSDAARQALMQALDDQNQTLRRVVLAAIAEIRPKSLLDPLAERMARFGRYEDQRIMAVILSAWPDTRALLQRLVDHQNPGVRLSAARALALTGDEEAQRVAVNALAGPEASEVFRREVAEALRISTGRDLGPNAIRWRRHFNPDLQIDMSQISFRQISRDGMKLLVPQGWKPTREGYIAPPELPGNARIDLRVVVRKKSGYTTARKVAEEMLEERTKEGDVLRPHHRILQEPAKLRNLRGKLGSGQAWVYTYESKHRVTTMAIAVSMTPNNDQYRTYLELTCAKEDYTYFRPLFVKVLESLKMEP